MLARTTETDEGTKTDRGPARSLGIAVSALLVQIGTEKGFQDLDLNTHRVYHN
jgi:hypothetical protein